MSPTVTPSEAEDASSIHHYYSVCMVSAQYPAHVKGTGVLIDYEGYSCIVAGKHLLPSPVAASTALVYFVLPGIQRPVTVSLRPKTLFELWGSKKSIAITACDRPIIQPVGIPPAIPAPAEYTNIIRRFSRSGRLQSPTPSAPRESPTGPGLPDASIAERDTATLASTANMNSASHGPGHRNKSLPQDRRKKPGEAACARTRRGAVVPGTKAYKYPNDPEPPEPFSITAQGGLIVMEMVAHRGRRKRAYRTAVLGQGVGRVAAEGDLERWRREEKGEGARLTGVQAAAGAIAELRVKKGGQGRGPEKRRSRGTTAPGEGQPDEPEEGQTGTGKSSCLGGESEGPEKKSRPESGEETSIAVVIADEEVLDGVHGAPVFVGGQLFGFAIQERVGEHVAEVIPASAFGLLPPPLDEKHASSASREQIPFRNNETSGPGGVAPTVPSSTGGEDGMRRAEENREDEAEDSAIAATAPPQSTSALLEKMIHLFRCGTPLSLELEHSRVGNEALTALRTPDGRSLVHLAAMSETLVPLEFVHRRLLMDVAFEEVPATGNTGLHLAAYCGRVKCLEYLHAQGGDLAKKNHHGQTPAMLAALTGRTEVLKWLFNATKGTADTPNQPFPEELLEMVEDMDEAAVYGSPMYRLLQDPFGIGSSDGEESESPEDEEMAAGPQPAIKAETTEEGTEGSEDDATVDFHRTWELYGRGEVDARRVLAVLTRIHGERLGAWWPLVLAALPPHEPHLVQALEAEKIGLDRARAEARVRAREEAESQTTAAAKERDGSGDFFGGDGARLPPGPADEDSCLRSATMKYIRGSIGAGRLYEEMVAVRGRVEEAVIAKVARGMPEDKAWALMDAHRKWRHEERLKKKRLRASRRAGATARRKTKKEDASAESEGGDDSSVASVFSLGASSDSCSLPAGAGQTPDLNQAVARYKADRLSAAELKETLSEVFGSQVECILPGVLAALPSKKRRELARLWRVVDDNKRRVRKSPRAGVASASPSARPPGEEMPSAVAETASKAAALSAPARVGGAWNVRGSTRHLELEPAGSVQGLQQQQQQSQPQKGVTRTTFRGGRKGVERQSRVGSVGQDPADDDDVLGPVVPKSNSPFTTRASPWAGKNGAPQEKEKEKERRDEKARRASGSGGGGGGGDGDGGGRDDREDEAEAAREQKKKRDSMASDAQRLTSEFAAGKLTAPHFFGAMMEEFGEERLLAALPDILRILPEDKAAALESFALEAEGEVGAAAEARRREKEAAEEERRGKERREKEKEEMERKQAIEDAKQKSDAKKAAKEQKKAKAAAAADARKAAKEQKKADAAAAAASSAAAAKKGGEGKAAKAVKDAAKKAAAAADDAGAAEANAEGTTNGGKKNAKKNETQAKGGEDVATASQALLGKIKAKKGKEKKKKTAEDSKAADGEDVEGGELFEMTGADRERYDKSFSKLSPDGGAVSPAKAASILAKSGLPRSALKRIWEMADVERDEQLNKDEWALAMHLVVCATARKLPLPPRLPRCLLRLPPSSAEQPPSSAGQPQQEKKLAVPESAAAGKKKKKATKKQKGEQPPAPETSTKDETAPRVDLKRATKEFKNGATKAEDFLPVLEAAFGKKELAKMWSKLLPTLPLERAKELADVAGVEYDASKKSPADGSLARQVGLKEATTSFKKGDMGAREYHESVLTPAFGDKLPEMMPQILKALPADRAAALKAASKAEADEVRRMAEEERQQWAMSIGDRRIYDNAFMKLDKDKDGFLSSAEARPMLKKAVEDRLSESQMRDLWKMADIDGDGRLTREEWAIAFHIVRCVIKLGMELPPRLPEVLGTAAGGRLPSV